MSDATLVVLAAGRFLGIAAGDLTSLRRALNDDLAVRGSCDAAGVDTYAAALCVAVEMAQQQAHFSARWSAVAVVLHNIFDRCDAVPRLSLDDAVAAELARPRRRGVRRPARPGSVRT